MELTGFVPIIRRWLGVILIATAVAAGVGLLLGASAEKTYEARAQLLVGPLSTDADTMRASGDLGQTYAELATTGGVLSRAARQVDVPTGELMPLGEVRQAGGKRVVAWALRGDLDVSTIVSNTFEMEWPPKSGRMATFPEVDRAEWFSIEVARERIVAGQVALLDRLGDELSAR